MRWIFCSLLIFSPMALADLVEHTARNSAPSGLLAGVARADITPPVGIPQMNWGAQTHLASIGTDPAGMIATALVVSDGRNRFAMVDVDALFATQIDAARKIASERTGIPIEHIRLGATHTHAGPFLNVEKGPVGVDLTVYNKAFDNYWTMVAEKVAGAIIEANSRLAPAHIGAMKGVGTINGNRRMRGGDGKPPAVGQNPDGLVDRDLNVARIDGADGKPMAVIVNFQCHGTVMAWENKYISPDWPGMMRKTVEAALPGARCLFFQGAAGNQGPIEGFTGDLGVAHRLGRILGHQASALALQIETTRRERTFEGFVESTAFIARQPWRVAGPRDGSLKFTSALLELPGRTYTPTEVDRMQTAVRAAEEGVKQAKTGRDAAAIHSAEARLRRVQDLLVKWKRPGPAQPVKVRLQMVRIGELAIVAMPGEPFAEIGIAIKKASPFATTMFCGYSTGEGGEYMPVNPEYEHAGYEVDRTPYGVGAAEKLVREAIALFPAIR